MNQTHKHITFEEVLLFLKAGKELPEEYTSCEVCRIEIAKAKEFLGSYRAQYYKPIEATYERVQKSIQTKDDLVSFLKQAEDRLEDTARPRGLTIWGSLGAAAAAALFVFNLYFDVLLPVQQVQLTSARPVQIERAGFFFGTRAVESKNILMGYDKVHLSSTAKTDSGFELVALKPGWFSFANKNILSLEQGDFLIHFAKGNRQVKLKSALVNIVGTTVRFDLHADKQVISVVEGVINVSAESKAPQKVSAGQKVSTSNFQVVKDENAKENLELARSHYAEVFTETKKVIAKTALKLIAWRSLIGKEQKMNGRALRRLAGKYGAVYQVYLKQGGYFYAARQKNSSGQLVYITSNGKVKPPHHAISQELQVR